MGRLFRSFDEAWTYFLARREPMERLEPPASPWTLAWLVPVAPGLVPRLLELQEPLATLPFVRLLPEHYFHVTVAVPGDHGEPEEAVRTAARAWHEVRPFEITIARVNCFHEAVVVEVGGRWELPELLAGARLEFVLPHVTIAGTDGGDPARLREVVVALRDAYVGRQRVTRVELCLVPTAPETFLQPWRVVGGVELHG